MHFRFLSFFSFFIAVLFLTGCGGGYSAKTPPIVDLATQKKADKRNDALILNAAAHSETPDEAYLIGPDDLLEIDAHNVEEIKKTVRVNSQGYIALPLAGILNVKGLTVFEVEQLIAGKLDKYVEETAVNVFIREYKSQRISVVGAVKKSQVFAVTSQSYLIDMLMLAEGISSEAGSICYVIRPAKKSGSGNDRATTIVIDLDDLLVNGNLSLNIPVYSGDVINVPKGGIFFVDGWVKTPGAYTMKGRTSLIQALSMAQGIAPDAAAGDIRIFRENSRGERDIIQADYDAISSGTSPDVMIAENDIIVVPQSGIKNFFNGFIRIVGGIVSLGLRPF
jgi:polysaccharide export outer membrane protein